MTILIPPVPWVIAVIQDTYILSSVFKIFLREYFLLPLHCGGQGTVFQQMCAAWADPNSILPPRFSCREPRSSSPGLYLLHSVLW